MSRQPRRAHVPHVEPLARADVQYRMGAVGEQKLRYGVGERCVEVVLEVRRQHPRARRSDALAVPRGAVKRAC